MDTIRHDHRLLNAAEVAARIGKPTAGVYALTRCGEFDDFLVEIGDKPTYRYDPAGLEAYIARGGRRRTEASRDEK